MTAERVRAGGCLCGAVRFSVAGTPLRVGLCHCQDCRRLSGSAFNFFGIWPKSGYNATGELRSFAGRSFCPNCGSRIASLRDDEAEIMIGALDDVPSDILPDYEIWIARREPWLMNLHWSEQFDYDRDPDAASKQASINGAADT
jgi:hypothetical protein